MKKVNFTLGLALAMLLVGANFVNAAKEKGFRTDEVLSTKTSIDYSIYVQANSQYISFSSLVRDYSWRNSNINYLGWGGLSPARLNLAPLAEMDNTSPSDITKKDSLYIYSTLSHPAGATISYESDDPINNPYAGIWGIEKRGTDLRNDFVIELSFKEGIEIMPSIKRTIVLGEWYYETDTAAYDTRGFKGIGNRMDPTEVEVIDYLLADTVWFRPDHDRKSGVARYVYSQDAIALFKKYPIYSISYEVSIHDEIGELGQEAYEPPMMTEPTDMRGLTFDIGEGITTNIPMNTIGNTLYVPSFMNYTFTVFSEKEIVATSNRSADPNDGIVVEKDKTQANAYLVTVKRVQSNFNITVVQKGSTQSDTGDDTTGNDGAAIDAVWGANGTLYVNAATPGTISIYSVTGQLYRQEAISGSYTLSMPKGLYIVQFNGKAYKVVL